MIIWVTLNQSSFIGQHIEGKNAILLVLHFLYVAIIDDAATSVRRGSTYKSSLSLAVILS
jgi:hypothetical protein